MARGALSRDPPAVGDADPPRLGIICDLVEENWPSMDLVSERLAHHLAAEFEDTIAAERLCPPLRRRLGWLPGTGSNGVAHTADRILNRIWDYPRWLRAVVASGRFDLFHIVDHSYAHLVHALPADRTVVTCHDVDAFRAILAPDAEPRSAPFRAMVRRTLAGLRRAAVVTCVSRATRDALLRHHLVPADRLMVVRNGVHPSRSPEPDGPADTDAGRLLGDPSGEPELLHVGSTIARKRIEVLLRIFAGVRAAFPEARLIRVGGSLTREQAQLADELGVADAIRSLPFLSQPVLSAVYRRAALLLLPSEREGFGLPVVESLASGTPVVVTDLAVLREVGGAAATYCPSGSIADWCEVVVRLLEEREERPDAWQRRRQVGLDEATRFSWATYTARMVDIYRDLAPRGRVTEPAATRHDGAHAAGTGS